MRRTPWLWLLLILLAGPVAAKEAVPLSEDPALEARLQALAKELRCLVCQNESLADSNADLARDLRREIREMMRQGRSDREVVEFLVARYGDFVLYRPPVKSTTLALWVGPFVLLAIGLGVLVVVVRRRPAHEPPLSEEEARKAETLLAAEERREGR
ncbi:cytochrome c-type biogenesis protein [Pelomicrobium sp.]|uniref:cytochrome c-type biogenesis protein n=1 Tax=Pelomicrobium sp. TaxID=2815319 RepID=UPI002FDE2CD8